MKRKNKNLSLPIYLKGIEKPGHTVLVGQDCSITYGEMSLLCTNFSEKLEVYSCGPIAIVSERTIAAVVAIYSTCWLGLTYIPINLKLPSKRIVQIIKNCSPRLVILVDAELGKIDEIMQLEGGFKVQILNSIDIFNYLDKIRLHMSMAPKEPREVTSEDIAYVMHTSGSTGQPKGVSVSILNVHALIDSMQRAIPLDGGDGIAQFAEFSFDASVYDLFVGISAGATIFLVPEHLKAFPVECIKKFGATVWSSVPSIGINLLRNGLLEQGALDCLRLTIFGGEPLQKILAENWHRYATKSAIINVYGPTEVTVNSLLFDCTKSDSSVTDIVPIGKPLKNVIAALIDEERREITSENARGELVLSGEQVANGYFGKSSLTSERFISLSIGGVKRTWYLTGDIAYLDHRGMFHYVCRKDGQIKILGKRVELEEIELILRKVSSSKMVAVIPWPVIDGITRGIVAFVEYTPLEPGYIRNRMSEILPGYMVPSAIYRINNMPLSIHGKIDRAKLKELMDNK